MSSNHNHSRELRKLAEDFFGRLQLPENLIGLDVDNLATCLVRQWITNDHVASIFLDANHQIYLSVGHSPLGQLQLRSEKGSSDWGFNLVEDWNIDPDEFNDIFRQINMGQSAEVVNTKGVTLRLWVDPKARTCNVEEVDARPRVEVLRQRDFPKIAFQAIRKEFGDSVPANELSPLAESIARQWKAFNGQAVIFRDSNLYLHFQWFELANGVGHLKVHQAQTNLGENLTKCGIRLSDFPNIVADLNLGKSVDLRLKNGNIYRLWTDPTNNAYTFKQLQPPPAGS